MCAGARSSRRLPLEVIKRFIIMYIPEKSINQSINQPLEKKN